MNKTYIGSCHCAAVRFTVDLDLAAGTNVSINLAALDSVSDDEISASCF